MNNRACTPSVNGMTRLSNPLFSPSVIDIFGDFFSANPNDARSAYPLVNVKEKEDKYIIELIVPGFEKEEIQVGIDDNRLNISGEKKEETSESTEKFTRREFISRKFSRSFALPEGVDADNIKANSRNGILAVEIPKAVQVKQTKQIVVE